MAGDADRSVAAAQVQAHERHGISFSSTTTIVLASVNQKAFPCGQPAPLIAGEIHFSALHYLHRKYEGNLQAL